MTRTIESKLTEVLIELTDKIGYDIKNTEHYDAYNKAYNIILQLIEYGENS
jgi:hypothetical protein